MGSGSARLHGIVGRERNGWEDGNGETMGM